jgi:hypothetical protein
MSYRQLKYAKKQNSTYSHEKVMPRIGSVYAREVCSYSILNEGETYFIKLKLLMFFVSVFHFVSMHGHVGS